MSVYEALDKCLAPGGIAMSPGDRIEYTEDMEKQYGLGKYGRDPKAGEKANDTGKVGYQWLRLVSKERLAKAEAPEGFIYHPLPPNTQTKEYADAGVRPTTWDHRH